MVLNSLWFLGRKIPWQIPSLGPHISSGFLEGVEVAAEEMLLSEYEEMSGFLMKSVFILQMDI